jgi:hypothetical protein
MSRRRSDPFNYQQHRVAVDELDLVHRAKRLKEAIVYASAIATVATASISFGEIMTSNQGRVTGAKTVK